MTNSTVNKMDPQDDDDGPDIGPHRSPPPYTNDIHTYQKRVEEITTWLYAKEEQLKQRQTDSDIRDEPFSSVLDEYWKHEQFIADFCEHSQLIMKCRADGQEMRENCVLFTEEDRDEIGIQIDSMFVCYEKLKILATDRLNTLRHILEARQLAKIEEFEQWLTMIENKISNFTSIEPDYEAMTKQMNDLGALERKLEQKQDSLNTISNFIIFDHVDPESLHIETQSCVSLDERMSNVNKRWSEVGRKVHTRSDRLMKAMEIVKLLRTEGPQLMVWLRKIESNINHMSETARDLTGDQTHEPFIRELINKSNKIDEEIKRKQSFYSEIETDVRSEIGNFDDPCSMFVIELERKLEDMQENWNTMMNKKRMLDYRLQALLTSACVSDTETRSRLIPKPGSKITSQTDTIYSSSLGNDSTKHSHEQFIIIDGNGEQVSNSRANDEDDVADEIDDLNPNVQLTSSFSDPRSLDHSLSSPEPRSLIYDINQVINGNISYMGNNADSQDEISSPSMTVSYSVGGVDNVDGVRCHGNLIASSLDDSVRDADITSFDKQCVANNDLKLSHHADCTDQDNSCRVEQWKHSLESFSTWLKRVESLLCINNSLETIIGPMNQRTKAKDWSRLELDNQLVILNQVEDQIQTFCQDEFECLMLQVQQIIEDLLPELDEHDYEANLKEILTDIEIRYAAVKRCLDERKQELSNPDRWSMLSRQLRNSSVYVIDRMADIIPETEIGIDLITLAQQQDHIMHDRTDLNENESIQCSIRDAKVFLRLCDHVQKQLNSAVNEHNQHDHTQHIQPHLAALDSVQSVLSDDTDTKKPSKFNEQIWLTLSKFREDIESQLDKLTLHQSELSQLIDDRLARLDEVHKEMHALQHKMQELAAKLQVAEILKSNWLPLDNLSIEKLSEQLEDLKMFRERVAELETIHKIMNSILDWMTESDVPLSQSNLKRITELNTIVSLIQVSVDERQKLIEQAFDTQSSSEQKFLAQTIADLPKWERRVATSKVPYFVDHENNKTKWDHPKFDDLLKTISSVNQYVFAAYRTAIKLRLVQRKLGIDMLMLDQLKQIFNTTSTGSHNNNPLQANDANNMTIATTNAFNCINNETLVGVEQIILILKRVYERIQSVEKASLDVPLSIDLTLNWLLNLYDSTRTGFISSLSLRVGLALMCCATREEKYTYMYELVASERTKYVDARKLGTLFETCMRIPIYLGEGDSFGGPDIIENSIRDCFSASKFNPNQPNSIDIDDYLNWLRSEPQFIIWLPVLHRVLLSENISHQVRCKLCRTKPMVGLRYRCLKCLKFNVCQTCFLNGRHIYEHYNPAEHMMQEYCSLTSSSDAVRDLTKILKNKLNQNPFSRKGSVRK